MLHAIASWIESFCSRHEHTISALEAFGTVAAVITALYTAQSAKRMSTPKIKAHVGVDQIMYGFPGMETPSYLTCRLANVGNVEVRLNSTFFTWRVPFSRTSAMAILLDTVGDTHVRTRSYPLILGPHTSDIVFVSSETMMKEGLAKIVWGVHRFRRLRARFIRAQIFTQDGLTFKATLGGEVRKEIARSLASGKPKDIAAPRAGITPD
jgi:hypothetical protein